MFGRSRRQVTHDKSVAADEAIELSKTRLVAAKRQGQEVRRVADRLRDLRQENHFAPSIRHAYRSP